MAEILTEQQLMAEALQLARYMTQADASTKPERLQKRQQRLRDIRQALQAVTHPICRESLAIAQIPIAVRQAFVQSVVLLSRYQMLGGDRWSGTLASPTLSQYEARQALMKWQTLEQITALCQAFELDAQVPTQLHSELVEIDHRIARQRQIMQIVLAELQPDYAPTKLQALFQVLFGVSFPAAAIACLHTESQLYFCLDVEGDALRDRALWDALSPGEQAAIHTFLKQQGAFSFEKFGRFPVFGGCDPAEIDREWSEAIATQAQASVSDVLKTLSCSVSIVPTQKAEAFLVHDIWGHHWQWLLTQFESDYAILTTCDEPLRMAETAYLRDGPLTCGELFQVVGDRVHLDATKARLFFHGEVQQRLGLMFTHLLGEMIADVAEFKFIWDHPLAADLLPSSSIFKASPTKLDLSLADIDFLFLKVLRPLLELNLSVLHDSALETELLSAWAQAGVTIDSLELRTSLKGAIAQLYQLWLEEYNSLYLPTLSGKPGIFTEIVRNLLQLHNVVDQLYTDATLASDQQVPFQDLLLLFIATYCSSDCYAEFWTVDNALADYFLPCWYQLTLL
ncbi:MAG TPA: hypothetical protein IGS53_22610 [Leptolyngbyaceae cyanobacterium M33_DOE_097]|uniref:Uncharacterized protein n=1 Tax=Oscillatoriales cyanobacterium SpSt-418 TaxID=2282169 RepID=A0A7C3KCF9_9CYAN|nr:hypothetical protein [Leptolyngbyaceae cyanobacterium M33_DOE_097]